jgi:PKD repeat protein
LKKKKQDIILQDLFRNKLENASVIPGVSVRSKLMRKQAQREFVRFNPARFNVYYLGALIIAGLTAAIMLSSSLNESNKPLSSTNINDSIKPVSAEKVTIKADQPISQKAVSNTEIAANVVTNKPALNSRAVSNHDFEKANELKKSNNITSNGNLNDSLSKDSFFTNSLTNKNKLQTTIKSSDPLFESSAITGCAPLKLNFRINSTSIDSCRWTFGDGGSSIEKSPDWIFDVEGEYLVVLKVFSSDGSQLTSSSLITVYPKPQARFEINPEKAILPKDEIRFSNFSSNAVHFSWDFGDGNVSDLIEPTHLYEKFGNYTVRLVAVSQYGCSDSLTVKNAFSGSEYFIDFPNAFIPSTLGPTGGYYSAKSDESAQVFHPTSSGVSDYQLKIFSKIGILIFESKDVNIGWDGYYRGQICEPGVYVWKVRGSFRNGEPFIKMGDVTLLRY